MNDARDRDKTKTETPARPARRSKREARLAEALRANLRRRKAQERGRSAAASDGEKDAPDKDAD